MKPHTEFYHAALALFVNVNGKHALIERLLQSCLEPFREIVVGQEESPFFAFIPMLIVQSGTVFENHRKSLIQHCERSQLRLHFKWTKVK